MSAGLDPPGQRNRPLAVVTRKRSTAVDQIGADVVALCPSGRAL
jgi:hypothetical protein